jgi:DNA helicase-2/ATP-dependent DNA helicase PcrA
MHRRRLDPNELLKDVNPAQREAICHVEGPLLVLAGAGSGKTRVVTRRVAYLLSQGVDPDSVLAITFTNKAAAEMRRRIEQLTAMHGLWVSTFHAMAARLLRRFIHQIGRSPDFTICDTDDRNKLIKEAIVALQMDPQQWRPSSVGSAISFAKNQLWGPDEYARRNPEFFGTNVAKVFAKYEELLERNNALDFDDLLLRLVEVLQDSEEVLSSLQRRFRFVLVDEYQDTNRPQYLIARMLTDESHNLHVTGDPDQSIYSWRGADINNILDFEKDFAGAKVVKLEQNYRSTQRILAAASAMIRHNRRRKEKDLWTENEAGEKVRLITAETETDEASQVARQIRRQKGAGDKLAEIAVFYRTNAQSRVLEEALMASNIHYVLVGGVAFYERKEVKDVLAYVRCTVNPRDDVSLERILNVPTRGIGKATLDMFKEFAAAQGISLLESLRRSEELGGLTTRARNAVAKLLSLHDDLAALPPKPISRYFHAVIDKTEYVRWLRASKDPDAEDRVDNVMELVSAAEAFEEENPESDIRSFLEHSALTADIDGWDNSKNAVALMTLHLAKGLEFPVVFVVGVEEGLLPFYRRDESRTPANLEEERRLCYVGMTRAMKHLFLCHALERRQFGQTNYNEASRFLSEIPPHALQPVIDVGADDEDEEESDDGDVDSDEEREDGDEAAEEETEFAVGDIVRHHRFGLGSVIGVEQTPTEVLLDVQFQKVGKKRLFGSMAHLERVK